MLVMMERKKKRDGEGTERKRICCVIFSRLLACRLSSVVVVFLSVHEAEEASYVDGAERPALPHAGCRLRGLRSEYPG